MIVESVEHGSLIWPTIEENGVTRTKKYAELSATEKLQANCDMKAINIILQGLPTEIYSLVNHHRDAKDLWEKVQLLMQGTSLIMQERECKLYDAFDKFAHIKGESLHQYYLRFTQQINDINIYNMKLEQFQLYAYLEQHELHANEVCLMCERNQDPLALVVNHQMTPPHFNTYQSSYNNPQFQEQFSPSQSQYGSTHPTQHYSTTYPSTPLAITYPPTPWTLGRPNSYAAGTPGTRANTSGARGNYSGPQMVVKCFNCQGEAQGNGKVLNEGELEFLADPGIAEAKAVLMANLSSYGSDVLSEVPYSENTNNDMLNQSVQEMTYSEHSQFVEHPENEIHSDSNIISYSQYLIESQTADVQDTNSSAQQDAMILSMFEQLSEQVTNCNKVNKDNLMANESLSAKLERYKERVKFLEERQNVDLSKKRVGSKMLLKQSDLMVLEKKVNTKPINYAELNRLSKDFGKRFVPQRELSDEQASHPILTQYASSHVKIEAPRKLPKNN
ncbi:hypothetical protein Tco_0585955 [Tanacetum coccineum]